MNNDFESFTEQKRGKKLILFGASELAKKVIDNFIRSSCIDYLVDNNPSKHGVEMVVGNKALQIYHPEKLLQENKDDMVVLITSSFYEEIIPQLLKYGIHNYFCAPLLFKLEYDFEYDFLQDQLEIIGSDAKVIFDVGSNTGDTTIKYLEAFPHARIFAFEPDPTNFEACSAKTLKYHKRCSLYPIALADSDGHARFHINSHSGTHSLLPIGLQEFAA